MWFKIYFEQINQQMYNIEADDEEQAILKAEKEWRMTFNNQQPSYIEKEGGCGNRT